MECHFVKEVLGTLGANSVLTVWVQVAFATSNKYAIATELFLGYCN